MAYIDDEPIATDDLLEVLEQEQWELLYGTVNGLVATRLVENEAAARGTTVPELVEQEIAAKVPPPDEAAIALFYERRKSSPALHGKTLDQTRDQIRTFLEQQALTIRRTAFLAELRAEHEVRLLLEPPRVDLPIPPTAPSKGPADAPVTVVEFADFECPACRRVYPAIERLLLEYKNDVRFVFRDFPLSIHPRAVPASVAAMCADEQDRFWDYYQNLMVIQGDLDDDDLNARAQQIGLERDAFATCYGEERHVTAVRSSLEQGRSVGVDSTPTFFINGRKVVGFPSYDQFKQIIDEEIARASEGSDG